MVNEYKMRKTDVAKLGNYYAVKSYINPRKIQAEKSRPLYITGTPDTDDTGARQWWVWYGHWPNQAQVEEVTRTRGAKIEYTTMVSGISKEQKNG